MKKLITFLFCLLSIPAFAQTGSVTVSGSHVVDSTGTALANGTIYFAPVNNSGVPLSYQYDGKGQAITTAASANVTNGAFSLTLADTNLTQPKNVCFFVTVINNVSGQEVLGSGYSCVQPAYSNSWCSAGVCNFDNYVPDLSPNLVTLAPNLSIGTTSTLSPGSDATASVTGTNPNYSLNLGIPAGASASVTLGSVTTGAPGSNASIINSGTDSAAILNFTIPAGAAGTITNEGVTGNYNVTNTLWSQDAISELPRVNVNYPAFATSCSNGADPTGVNDSTCAIQAAITYATGSGEQGNGVPVVYLPAGTYKISDYIALPCWVHFVGDGEQSTTIEQTSDTANFLTVSSPSGNPAYDAYGCQGSIEDMKLYSPNGHSYTGTGIEIQNSQDYLVQNVVGSNIGGRGIETAGSSERQTYINTEWDNTRWSMILNENEIKAYRTLILAPGIDAGNYCYDANCPGGAQPGTTWTVAQQLVSASGNGTTATYVIKGGSDSGSTNGVSPIVAGNYFTIGGITDVTGLNGVYQIASLTNNSPVSGEYTVTAANTTSGTASAGTWTYQPTMIADHEPSAVFMSGATIDFEGASIKEAAFSDCIHATGLYSGIIEGVYCEGYPTDNRPTLHSFITVQGEAPTTTLSASLSGSANNVSVDVTNNEWFPDYVNNPSDETAITGSTIEICPQDYNYNSTTASAYVSGVEQDECENVTGLMTGGNALYVSGRNQSGSTAPSGTTWPSGSIVGFPEGSPFGVTKIADNHISAIVPPGNSNWAAYCDDSTSGICADVIVGEIPSAIRPSTNSSGKAATNPSVEMISNEIWGVTSLANELTGEGFWKVSVQGSIYSDTSSLTAAGVTTQASQIYDGNIYPVTEGDGSIANLNAIISPSYLSSPVNGFQLSTSISSSSDPVESATLNGAATQFENSECWYDTPTTEGHSSVRYCMSGLPDYMSNTALFAMDVWNSATSTWEHHFATYPNTNGGTSNTVYATGADTSNYTWLNANGQSTTSSDTFNGPGLSGDTFHWWSGTADVASSCGWDWTSTGTPPTGLNYIYSCGSNQTLPIHEYWSGLAAGSIYDLSDWPEVKAASLLASGIVDGTAPVTVTTGSSATLGGTYNSGYTDNEESTASAAVTYTLPTAAAGKQYCVDNSYNGTAADTGTLKLATSATGQYIIFTDGTLSASGGYVISGGAARDSACVRGVDSTHWMLYVYSGTWAKH